MKAFCYGLSVLIDILVYVLFKHAILTELHMVVLYVAVCMLTTSLARYFVEVNKK